MKNSVLIIVIFLVGFLCLPAALSGQTGRMDYCDPHKDAILFLNEWLFQPGDSSHWKNVDYNDSHWTAIINSRFNYSAGEVGWLRKNVMFADSTTNLDRVLLRTFYMRTDYRIYWDGILLYENASQIVNNRNITQPSILVIPIPPELCTKGKHVISIRFLDLYKISGRRLFRVDLILNPQLRIEEIGWWISNSMFLGVLITCLVIGVVLLWGDRRYRSFIFFTLLCINTIFWIGLRISLPYFNLPIEWIGLIFNFELFAYSLFDVFLFLFICFHLDIPNKIFNISLVTLLSSGYIFLYIFNYDISIIIRNYFFLLFLYLIFLIAIEIRKKKEGAVPILWGFSVYAAVFTFPFVIQQRTHIIETVSMTFLLLMIVLSIRQKMKNQSIQQHLLERRADRLQIELLKKSIQPHFILNTLASIKSLSKRNPDKAGFLIQSLADEFRIINKISAEKEISLLQELELCEQHLELMGYRNGAKYTLQKVNIDSTLKVPPLIFHTLIENGLTHAFDPLENGKFWFSYNRGNGYFEYILQNDGSLLEKLNTADMRNIEEGTGIKYVKSRLEERYPGKWELNYGMKDSLWEVSIKIYRNT